MIIPAGKFSVEVVQVAEKGTAWEVRAYKKVFGFKKRISSDWFLESEQAKKFATQLVAELQSNNSTANLTGRPPGWTLRRPDH